MELNETIKYFLEQHQVMALCVIVAISLLEYVFPPVPGDVLTFAAAFLVTLYGWPLIPVFLVVVAGGLIGTSISYYLGTLLNRKRGEWLLKLHKGVDIKRKLDEILDKFARYGTVFIVVNRFFPGIRALFLVAAGMARIPLPKVLLFSLISSVTWNSLIFGLGYFVGNNIELFESIISDYFSAIWIIIATTAALLTIRYLFMKRKKTL